MNHSSAFSLAGFLAQSDGVTQSTLFILFIMSIATWYFITVKSIQALTARQHSKRFLDMFWNAPSLQAVVTQLQKNPNDPFSRLTYHAVQAVDHHARHGAARLNEAGSAAEFVTRAIRRIIDEETARIESGLTVLASVGSTAPFVGLFGTVWGVYQALTNIGMTGQGSLDKVAGPVGEALIMTALGLVVAIPAVLAYNASLRSNRLLLSRLDAFAHDLFAFLTTGSHVNDLTPMTAKAAANQPARSEQA